MRRPANTATPFMSASRMSARAIRTQSALSLTTGGVEGDKLSGFHIDALAVPNTIAASLQSASPSKYSAVQGDAACSLVRAACGACANDAAAPNTKTAAASHHRAQKACLTRNRTPPKTQNLSRRCCAGGTRAGVRPEARAADLYNARHYPKISKVYLKTFRVEHSAN